MILYIDYIMLHRPCPPSGELCEEPADPPGPRGSSSDLTDHDALSSGEEEDHFGDDELTDTGRSSSEQLMEDSGSSSTGSMFKSPSPPSLSLGGKGSLPQPSDLGTLQSGPSQPKLRRSVWYLTCCM